MLVEEPDGSYLGICYTAEEVHEDFLGLDIARLEELLLFPQTRRHLLAWEQVQN